MDWKEENPNKRYIDSITWEEAKMIAFLAAGQPDNFMLLKIDAWCNDNNIPHVKLEYESFDDIFFEKNVNYIGIFHNLNTYMGSNFSSTYCQREVFKAYEEMGFD